MSILSIIVAVDENNAIGYENKLLCYLPNDLKYFKSVTQGHTVIMGRKTYQSLPNGALPNRRNIVVTRDENLSFDRCEIAHSLSEAFARCEKEDEVFVIGGGMLYKEAMAVADRIYITRIHHRFDQVDTFFPVVDSSLWKEVSVQRCEGDEKHPYAYSFIVFDKIKR